MSERSFSIEPGQDTLILRPDNWNDYGFTTLYDAYYRDLYGNLIELGGVKIGCLNYDASSRPLEPGRYKYLTENYFSVGQDQDYYENIAKLGNKIANNIFATLQDMAWDESAYARAQSEEVTQTSLYRQVTADMVTGQFRRIARGGEVRESFQLDYTLPQLNRNGSHPVLSFRVNAGSTPPTNLHILIGRNGVGKTSLLRNMVAALTSPSATFANNGTFTGADFSSLPIVNLVMIAFSAFDPFHEYESNNNESSKVKFSHVGLSSRVDDPPLHASSKHASNFSLDQQFVSSIESVFATRKGERWLRLIEVLENDPIFESYDLLSLGREYMAAEDVKILSSSALDTFNLMSSGHKIVLLTVTRLVEKVAERTMVLIDEPESHLHPPLLANLLRAVSLLLTSQNGLAFIATHSPVVLQEVPRACVWSLRRHGDIVDVARPKLETFGENVGILTHDVFGLEVEGSGFHQIVRENALESPDYESFIERFDNQLGSEARGIARILTADKRLKGDF